MNNRNRCTENLKVCQKWTCIYYIYWICEYYIGFSIYALDILEINFKITMFNMTEKLEDKILNFGRAQGTTKIMTGNNRDRMEHKQYLKRQ